MVFRILKKVFGGDVVTIPDPADYELKPVRSFYTKVVGVTKRNADGRERQKVIARCRVDDLLLLIREKDNPHDPNAIAVYRATNEQIGYISADIAEELAPDMDSDVPISVRISDLTGGTPEKPSRGVNLEIRVFKP